MTLLYIHQYFVFPDTPGGTRSYDLATYFAGKGIKVIIITSSSFLEGSFDKRWTVLFRDNLEIHVLRSRYSNQLSYLQRTGVFLHFMLQTTVRALKIKADLLLATSTPITVAVPALFKRRLQRTPFIFEVRDVWPEAPVAIGALKNRLIISVLKWFEKHVYKRAAHIVALSSDMKQSIVSRTKTEADKITVIPNIANITRFAAVDPDGTILKKHLGFVPERSLIYAGAFGTLNGLDVIIELAKHTREIDPALVYVFAGWGVRKQQLIHQAQSAGLLGKNVFIIPPIPKNALSQLYAECTVTSSFVLPIKELWANSANKFFDSLAAGRPVVINYEGWQAELVRRHNIGFVIPHKEHDMKKVATDFCAYINNSALLALQRNNAKALAAQFSLPAAGEKYFHILQNINAQ
jgi:glycosyltransferase involved in cell wall biosynthesis